MRKLTTRLATVLLSAVVFIACTDPAHDRTISEATPPGGGHASDLDHRTTTLPVNPQAIEASFGGVRFDTHTDRWRSGMANFRNGGPAYATDIFHDGQGRTEAVQLLIDPQRTETAETAEVVMIFAALLDMFAPADSEAAQDWLADNPGASETPRSTIFGDVRVVTQFSTKLKKISVSIEAVS